MDSEQRRKRKRHYRPYSTTHYFFSLTSLLLCFSFFLFFSLPGRFSIRSASLNPVVLTTTTTAAAAFSLLSRTSRQDSLHGGLPLPFRLQARVLFPDHLLLMVSSSRLHRTMQGGGGGDLHCVYYRVSGELIEEEDETVQQPVLSVDDYDGLRSIARCPLPPANFTAAAVALRRREDVVPGGVKVDHYKVVHSWERMVYEAVVDGDTVVVFAKGLNLRPHKESDPAEFKCQFGLRKWDEDKGFAFVTEAVAAAQEVVRCSLPRSIQNNPDKAQGIQVTIVQATTDSGRGAGSSHSTMVSSTVRRRGGRRSERKEYAPMPSLAKLYNPSKFRKKQEQQYELCVCTMLWNQAAALKEWVMYHSWLGVQRWFIYDNNSDDEIQQAIDELDLQNYNVSRHTWPWIKTQEAGFSHCALRAKSECKWIGFFDVDEFFYFNGRHRRGSLHQNSLRSLVANFSSSMAVAELRTACHSFGPSGLRSPPVQGVMAGYTCRLQAPERHKSIVRPALLNETLLNVVHHFQLRQGYTYFNVGEDVAVINHYKYQVWETFRAKFYRRVATYVADWQEHQNEGSKDRAPGLGTEAIEPPNWRRQFCEVWDTGLRDVVLANFADPAAGTLPWQKSRRKRT